MDLSAVIVNWNTRDFLRKCLLSLNEHRPAGDFEVIVVDNASSDGSAKMVREEFPSAVLIANEENRGYAEGNNQGIGASRGRHILLLNPDTEVRPGALDALVRFAEERPETGAVAPRLIGPDGRVQSSCRSFPEPLPVLFEYLRLSRIFPKSRLFGAYRMTYFDYESEMEVDQPMASCLLVPRKAVEDVGVFDTDFPIFFNEVDWCRRAKSGGWKVFFTPSAEILHHGGASTRQMKPEMVRESHRSLLKFYEKHYRGRLFPPVYWFITAAVSINSRLASAHAGQGRSDA